LFCNFGFWNKMAARRPSWTRFQPTSNLAEILVQYISTPNLKPLNQSIQKISIGHRQNAKFARLFNVWPLWPWKVGQIQNLGRMFRTVTQNLVFLAIGFRWYDPLYVFQDGRQAAILKMRERKKCSFQYTTPSRTYSIKLVIVAFCFATDGRTDGRKTWKQYIRQLSSKVRLWLVTVWRNSEIWQD
jgi:hypothetical protein